MKMFKFNFGWIAIAISLVGVGCTEARLGVLPPEFVNIQSKGEFCTMSPEDIDRHTKFLFIVDKSGSNGSTDPGATKRADNIDLFYQDNKDNESFQWGLITFQNGDSNAEISDGNPDNPIFTTEENQVNDAIDSLRSGDSGSTPYRAALNLARKAIEDDIELYPEEDNIYMLFFITDGVPTDYNGDQALYADVKNLVDLVDNRIFLSTAYYGPGNGSAENRLREMADVGKGKFVNFNNTDNLDFNDLIVLPTKEPWQIKDNLMLVYNLNSTVCEDGEFGTDSDADGLCDKDEKKYGFDPQNRFSTPPGYEEFAESWYGYGDYFRWRAVVFEESLPPCEDRSDEDHDLLTYCEETYIVNADPKGTDNQSGDPLLYDTDKDGFIDGIETIAFKYLNKGAGAMDDTNMSQSFDGESADAGTQIREHRNPLAYDAGADKYDLQITMKGFTPTGQTCYRFRQDKLRVYPTLPVSEENTLAGAGHKEGENAVLVYFIQTPHRDPNGDGILMYSVQKLFNSQTQSDALGRAAGLKINNQVFKTYKPPKN